MNERLLRYARLAAIPAFYLFALAVCASLTFPYDKLKERITSSFNEEQRTSGGQQELEIDDLGGYWLTGLRMKGVTLLMGSTEPGKPPTRLVIDEATARYSILAPLVGNSELSFGVDAFGGSVNGTFAASSKEKAFEATIENVDLGKVTPLVQTIGLPLAGQVGGKIRLTMPDGKMTKSAGAISLESKGTSVGDGKAKLKGALTLPRVDVGTLTISADVKDGVVKFTKFVAGGKDMDVQGDGRITLHEQATDSLADMQVKFRITDSYRSKSDVTKNLFGAPGSSIPPAFELDPQVRASKRADGFYGWAVRGALAHLEFAASPR